MDHTLFTYRNLEELRKIQEEREVFAFIFGETKDMLDSCSEVCIDISALVHFLITNKNNIEPTYINFTSMAEDTVVIAEVAIAESAMELLPLLFSDYKCYFEEDGEENSSSEETHEFKPYPRQKIYKYNNAQDLDIIIRYAETNDIPIATFSRASGELRKEFEQFNKSSKLAILDLTSVSYAIEDNKALIYALEQFLSIMPNIRVIAQTSQIDVLLKYFPLFLDGQEPVCKLLPDLSGLGEKEPEEIKLTKVTDLSGGAFDAFINAFNHNLIGHNYFKERLRYALKNDMDGYVIIFTSNLLSEAEYKKAIPTELQTRFDLVCEFEEPTMAEKTAFLDLLLEMAKTKYSEQFAEIEMTEDEKKQLYAFDYSSLSALRDIKRVFNNRLMDYFAEKGVLR